MSSEINLNDLITKGSITAESYQTAIEQLTSVSNGAKSFFKEKPACSQDLMHYLTCCMVKGSKYDSQKIEKKITEIKKHLYTALAISQSNYLFTSCLVVCAGAVESVNHFLWNKKITNVPEIDLGLILREVTDNVRAKST